MGQIPCLNTDSERVSSLVIKGFFAPIKYDNGHYRQGFGRTAIWVNQALRDIHNVNLPNVDLNLHNVVVDEHNDAYIIDRSMMVRTYGWYERFVQQCLKIRPDD